MRRIYYTLSLIIVALFTVFSCKKNVPEVKFTDKGPQMEVKTIDNSAYMGGNISFTVNLKDEFPLSTLKARLYFDDTQVSEKVIRTKQNGEYKDVLSVPLFADIPDGTATLELIAQNTGLGITKHVSEVEIKRPNFDFMNLKIGDKVYKMEKTGNYSYSVEGNFPAKADAFILSPELENKTDVIKLGWDGKSLSSSSNTEIPFSAAKDGLYRISIDLMKLSASPFGNSQLELSEAKQVEVIRVLQGTVLKFKNIPGITTWDLDYDFFEINTENDVTFKAIDGLYKFTADFGKKFIKVEPMKDNEHTLTLKKDCSGALWMIGGSFGKPAIGPSWDTNNGAYAFASIKEKVYRMTLVAGASIAEKDFSIKAFHQKGWGGEIKSYSSLNDETGLFKVTDSGNIEIDNGKKLKKGKAYVFEVDYSSGNKPLLHISETVLPVKSLNILINGVQAERVTLTLYSALIDIKKGDAINVSGQISGLEKWYMDPDYLKLSNTGLKFNAASGKYMVFIDLELKYAYFKRMKDAENKAEIADHALWMMGWGIGTPVLANQFKFTPGTAFCMAEVDNMVFRITGIAVSANDKFKFGGRFCAEKLSIKYFGQDGWGAECGKIFNKATEVKFTPEAAKLLKLTNTNNIELKDNIKLEEGATYVLTIDLSKANSNGIETIDFIKK